MEYRVSKLYGIAINEWRIEEVVNGEVGNIVARFPLETPENEVQAVCDHWNAPPPSERTLE